ncbi:MAG TPA: VCBS repeat-containing protein [Actinomycetota bacterium]|nr:VCBS repeat-containing protein [Actinomycetota bacterium]
MASGRRGLTFAIATIAPLLLMSACPGGRDVPIPAPSPAPAAAFELQALAGTAPATRSWGAAWGDVDGDGAPDLLVGRHKGDPWMFSNHSGRFEQLPEPALAAPAPGKTYYDRHNCAWGEANGDGRRDLYCVSGASGGRDRGPNRLLLGSPSGLRDGTPRALRDALGRGRSVNWLDYDSDGDLDLFAGNEERAGSPNALFENVAGTFQRRRTGVEATMATVSSTAVDWDLDGDPDLAVLGHGHSGSHLYENAGGSFREIERAPVTGREWLSAAWADYDQDADLDMLLTGRKRVLVLETRGRRLRTAQEVPLRAGRAAIWLDVENDGDADVFVVQGRPGRPPLDDPATRGSADAPDYLILNEGGRLSISEPFAAPGASPNGDAVAASDYDRDGRLDLVVTNGYLRDRGRVVLAHNTTAARSWGALDLSGPSGNPDGIGATVRVLGDRPWVVPVTDGVVFRSQSETGYVPIGLGARAEVEARVEWPGGTVDCVTVRAGRVATVRMGSSPC